MTTSPFQNNDYNTLQFLGYQLPTDRIANTVRAMNSYWEEGARELKAAYNNILNIELTTDQNKQFVKESLTNIKKQFENLRFSNLGDQEVQNKALSLYDPIISNKNIQLDNAITLKKKSVITEAQSLKNKNKGEAYSDGNLIVSLRPFNNFNSDTDVSELESIYNKSANARYIPAWNVQKSLLDAKDACGSYKTIGNKINDKGYDVTISEGGVKANSLAKCFEALPPQALDQIRVNGILQYMGNPKSLASDLTSTYDNEIKKLKELRAANSGVIAAKKDLTPEEIEKITKENSILDSKISNYKTTLEKFQKGDYSDLDGNYDDLSAEVYSNRFLAEQAIAMQDYEYKEEFALNDLFKMQREFDYSSSLLEQKEIYNTASKERENNKNDGISIIENPDAIRAQIGSAEEKIQGYSLDELRDLDKQAKTVFYDELKNLFVDLRNVANNSELDKLNLGNTLDANEIRIFFEFADKYYKQHLKDGRGNEIYEKIGRRINTLYEKQDQRKMALNLLNEASNLGEVERAEKNFLEENKGKSFTVKTYENQSDRFLGRNQKQIVITPERFVKIKENTDPDFKMDWYGPLYTILSKNGNKIVDIDVNNHFSLDALSNNYDATLKNPKKVANDILQKRSAVQQIRYAVDNTREASQLKRYLAGQGIFSSSMKPEDINEKITVNETDGMGTVYLTLFNPDSKKENDEDYFKRVHTTLAEKMGSANIEHVKGGQFVLKNQNEFNFDNTANKGLLDQSYGFALDKAKQSNGSSTIIQRMSKTGKTLELVVNRDGSLLIRDAHTKQQFERPFTAQERNRAFIVYNSLIY